MQIKWYTSFHILKSTWTILGGIMAGVLIGIFNKSLAFQIAPLGELYLSFLKMCVIPIMVTAIVSSVGSMLLSGNSGKYLKRMLVVFIVSLFLVSLIGLTAGILGKPGEVSEVERLVLGQVLIEAESGMSSNDNQQTIEGLPSFLLGIIPPNIFTALGEGNSLQILFFSIIFGVAVGLVPSNANHTLLSMIDLIFKAFQHAISWTMYVLPFGLLAIMAGQIASTGVGLLLAMIKFIIIIHIAAILIMLSSAAIISYKSRIAYFQSIKYLKKCLIIAFGTRNSIATMPSALEALRNDFKLDAKTINLVIPLGVILCRYSMVLVFSLAIVFIAQLYDVPLGVNGLLIALIGSVLAALAGAGSPGVISLSMLSIVAIPLGLPYGAVVILLLAVNPIIDPIITAANIHLNCASAVLIADQTDDSQMEVQNEQDLLVSNNRSIEA